MTVSSHFVMEDGCSEKQENFQNIDFGYAFPEINCSLTK